MAIDGLPLAYHGRLSLRVGYNIQYDTFDVSIVAVGPDDRVTHIGTPVLMAPLADRYASWEPTLRVGGEVLQEFVDRVAKATTIKPESDAKLQGQLEATKAHLADMRQLVFTRPAETDRAITAVVRLEPWATDATIDAEFKVAADKAKAHARLHRQG